MTTVTSSRPSPTHLPPSGQASPSWRRTVILAVLVAVLLAVGVLGTRLILHHTDAAAESNVAAGVAVAQAGDSGPALTPAAPQIESTWGIRISGIQVAAARGLVLMRYQVLDEGLSGKLHVADNSGVPELYSEDADGSVTTVAMGHNHYYGNGLVLGRTFVIIYGNAGGLLKAGDHVTVRMPDGLELNHVLVQT